MSQPTSGYLYARNIVRGFASTLINGTATTTGIDLSQFDSNGITLIFDCSAVVGAGSLALQVQSSKDNVTFANITGATATVNAAGLTLLYSPNCPNRYICIVQTLTGTSVTYSWNAYGNPAMSTTSGGYTTSPAGT